MSRPLPPVRTPENFVVPLGASERNVTGTASGVCPVVEMTSDPETSPGVDGDVTESVTERVAPGAMVTCAGLTVPNDV